MIPPTIARGLIRNIGKFMSEITAGALTAIGGAVAKTIKAFNGARKKIKNSTAIIFSTLCQR
jgi:hypothetical protein